MILPVKRKCLCCGNIWFGKNNDRYPKCSKCYSLCWDKGYNSKCEMCNGLILIPEIHHKDKNPRNNKLNNRLGLCRKCHKNLHYFARCKNSGNFNARKFGKLMFNPYIIKELIRD